MQNVGVGWKTKTNQAISGLETIAGDEMNLGPQQEPLSSSTERKMKRGEGGGGAVPPIVNELGKS